jgi:cell division septation protein DedD
MIASRRTFRPRAHPRRGGQFAVLALTCLVLLSLSFLLGFLVGRRWAGSQQREAQVEKETVLAGGRSTKGWELRRLPQIQERLTFYQTLTAPPGSTPPNLASKAPDGRAPVKETEKEQELSGKRGAPAGASSGSSTALGAVPAQGQPWTLQVAAYRRQTQAAALQRSLIASGYDAYLTMVSGPDGTVHYRVRVGNYPTRAAAEKVSEQLRAERSLVSLVIPR